MAVSLGAPAFQLPVPGLTVLTPTQWNPVPDFRDEITAKPSKLMRATAPTLSSRSPPRGPTWC